MIEKIVIRPEKKVTAIKYVVAAIMVGIAFYNPGELLFFLVPFSIVVISTGSGIEIEPDNNRIRSFYTLLWIKKGKWLKLNQFKAITIKKSKKGALRYSGRTNVHLHLSDYYYEVLLTSSDFRRKLRLMITKTKSKSVFKAKKWSYQLNLPLIKYDPQPYRKKQKNPAPFKSRTTS